MRTQPVTVEDEEQIQEVCEVTHCKIKQEIKCKHSYITDSENKPQIQNHNTRNKMLKTKTMTNNAFLHQSQLPT